MTKDPKRLILGFGGILLLIVWMIGFVVMMVDIIKQLE